MPEKSVDRIIISDTSCLISLVKINKLDILKKMYTEIIITPEVAAEFKHPLPDWIKKKDVINKSLILEFQNTGKLHTGEASSIALALETKNSTVILDEDRARKFARQKGLSIIGTLGILSKACDLGFIESYEKMCEDLHKTNFRFNPKIQNDAKKHGFQR